MYDSVFYMVSLFTYSHEGIKLLLDKNIIEMLNELTYDDDKH